MDSLSEQVQIKLDSIITPEVKHQIALITSEPNLSSLWNIKFFSAYDKFHLSDILHQQIKELVRMNLFTVD